MVTRKEAKLAIHYQAKQNVVVALKGSKSLTNRALILAAQAPRESKLINYSISDDSQVLIAALTKFGVEFREEGDTLIVNSPEILTPYQGQIDVGPAGTSSRFLTAFIAGVAGAKVELTGSARLQERPISDLVNAIDSIASGISVIKYLGAEGCLPLQITGMKRKGNSQIELAGHVSSQYLSALLLTASSLAQSLEIHIVGEQVSKSYVEMTIAVAKAFGVNVIEEESGYYLVYDSRPEASEFKIDGDATGAGYFLALAMAHSQKIEIQNLTANSNQGDWALVEIFKKQGAKIDIIENGLTIDFSGDLTPFSENLIDLPDSGQTLAVLAALVPGTSRFTGLSTLKNKETDRLAAVATELKKLGIESIVGDDYIEVQGGNIDVSHQVLIDTYDDHRMAMSFAILASKLPQIEINDPEVVGKSFPDFWQKLEDCGARY